ncbi:MAG: hypothetical protein AB4041_03475 [Microcystaceae cyanobacterium]
MLSGILTAYDEPKILSLVYRLGQSDKVDYSKLHKHLHHAVYLPNHAAYVDYMTLPRKQVQFESTDIVAMYCYLLWEIKQQLNEEIGTELKALAERFQEQYLKAEYSLFDEQSYTQVIDSLKDSLEMIDHNTPLKDADYWELYEAIELFLYGEMRQDQEGEVWGINNFHSVWESMCLTYIAKNNKLENILYLDTQFISDNLSQILQKADTVIDLSNAFKINGSNLRPDAVMYSTHIKKSNRHQSSFEIIDVKYFNINYFLNDKHKEDIKMRSVRKQFVFDIFIA